MDDGGDGVPFKGLKQKLGEGGVCVLDRALHKSSS